MRLAAAFVAVGCAAAVPYLYLVKKPREDIDRCLRELAHSNYDTRVDIPIAGPFKNTALLVNETADQLAQSRQQRDDFLSNVSHEFKTPLAYIQRFAMLLGEENATEDERREYLQGIVQGTQRLSKMVGSMLELALASDPASTLEVARFSLDEQLRHAVATFVPLMTQKGLDFDVDFEAIEIEGNEPMLGEVWANLLSNSVKYTPEGGTIRICALRRENRAIVTVQDTGMGIPKDRIGHVFERFYRDETAQTQEGVGLGLAIAKAIVEKHHGTIAISSTLGRGTTCRVELPLR